MILESMIFAALLGAGLLLLARSSGAKRSRVVAGLVLLGSLGIPALIVWQRDVVYPVDTLGEAGVDDRPIVVPRDDYVGSSTCQSCHPQEHATWKASYHSKMTQLVSPESVIGRFDGKPVDIKGSRYIFERVGDEYWIDIEDPDWHRRMHFERQAGADIDIEQMVPRRIRKRLSITTGSHNKQVYWYPSGETRLLGQLDVYWLPEAQAWIPRRSGFLIAPSELHGAETGRWNNACIRCHAVNGRPRQEGDRKFDTQVSELSIACESCHGPGGPHVEVNRNPLRRYGAHLGELSEGQVTDDRIVNPAKLLQQRSTEVCGQCHGLSEFKSRYDAYEWGQDGFTYQPGGKLSDDRLVLTYEDPPTSATVREWVQNYPHYYENRFWKDGQVRMAGREFTALLETPCYQAGEMTCLSCHSMHPGSDDPRPLSEWAVDQLKPGMEGNQACLQCHSSFAVDIPAHSHHAADSSGSDCMNCHMAFTAYGLLKVERSHLVNSPDAAVDLVTGRTNACNLCHLDRSLGWAAQYLKAWYDTPVPPLNTEQREVSAAVLALLTGDAQQRVLVAQSMGWESAREASGEGWMAPYLSHLMADPYDVIRYISHRSLTRQQDYAGISYNFLADPDQRDAVRAEVLAAWSARSNAGGVPAVLLDDAGRLMREAFDRLAALRNNRPVNLQE